PPGVGNIFPNALFVSVFTARADAGFPGALGLHAYVPKGPDKLEFVNYLFAEKDAPEQVKRDMLQNGVQQLGTSGVVEQDDSDVWPAIFRNTYGVMSRARTLKYQALVGHNPPKDWGGGGRVYPGFTKDDTQWDWWLAYHQMMS